MRYVVDQNPASFRSLRKPWMSKGPAMGLISKKAILGWQLKAGGGCSHHCSSWWWCWLVVGCLVPSHPACGVSLREVTRSEVAERYCMLLKWSTVCSYCRLLIKRLVVHSSVYEVLWVERCFLVSNLNLWMVIWGCGPSYRLLLPGRVWPHPSPPSLPMPQLRAAHRCLQCPHGQTQQGRLDCKPQIACALTQV